MTMVNPYAGEVALVVDGESHVLKLTLGALAELEEALGTTSLIDLVERFERGQYTVRDVLALILAGLRGGGWRGDAETLANADIAGGAVEVARVAAQLLARAFALPETK
jgi:hypothetical protein